MKKRKKVNHSAQRLLKRRSSGEKKIKGAAIGGARSLPVLENITQRCTTPGLMENALVRAGKILADSKRVFCYRGDVVMEVQRGTEKKLVFLSEDGQLAAVARSLLANLFVCEAPRRASEEIPTQFPPPQWLAELIVVHEPTLEILPKVTLYARRPMFDEHFRFCGPGYHEQSGILVHSDDLEPEALPEEVATSLPAIERLPPYLRELLRDFAFSSDADLDNAVGALLTGVLMSHFIEPLHPVLLLDGNQPGLGKTLLAEVIGMVLDGVIPNLIKFSQNDEELEKKSVAHLRRGRQSLLIFDNAKTKGNQPIISTFLESATTTPDFSGRILGRSQIYARPNDLLWVVTMNNTSASPDLVDRGLPIRFYFEGDAAKREFAQRDPLEFARQHRLQVLAELFGMVERWNAAGRPQGTIRHRLSKWASVIGGILSANGLDEGLTNLEQAAADFDAGFDELAALAEKAVGRTEAPQLFLEVDPKTGQPKGKLTAGNVEAPPADWVEVFISANVVLTKADEARSARSKGRSVGEFFAPHINHSVKITSKGREGDAKLCMRKGRSNTKYYHFEIRWLGEEEEPTKPGRRKPKKKTAAESDRKCTPARQERRCQDVQNKNCTPTENAVDQQAPLRAPGGNDEAW